MAGRSIDGAIAATAGSRRDAVKAVLLVLASGIVLVGLNALVKHLTASLDPMMITWGRYFFHVAFVLVLFPKSALGVRAVPQMGLQIGRSALLLTATIANFWALALLPLAEVAAIIFSTPILVACFAMVMLKEQVAPLRWVLIATGFAGALLVVQPGGAAFGLGALLAFTCTCASALYQVTTRSVRATDPTVSLLYAGLLGTVALTLALPLFWQSPTLWQWALLVVVGSLGAGGHLLMTQALQLAEASKMAPFTYVKLVWAMLASFALFGDVPAVATVVGAVVIVTSGLLLYRLDVREAGRG